MEGWKYRRMTLDDYRTKFNKVYAPLDRARTEQIRRYAAIEAMRFQSMSGYLDMLRKAKRKYA